MKYESTRGSEIKKTAPEAIIAGIAEDKGLYVPGSIPKLDFNAAGFVGKTYKYVASKVLSLFFDDFTEEEIKACVDGAYDEKFRASDIVEVKNAGGAYFIELYHGKTCAFKDMALSILPYLMTASMRKTGEKAEILILTATSGDTGKAALEGFADVPNTSIMVFYPDGGVSNIQRLQMVTQEGKNTKVFGIRGNFDDAQTAVKKVFTDENVRKALSEKGIKLSSANSINIGRLVPQVAYYVYSYFKLVEEGVIKAGEKVNITVPTGNFGNILAAYLAKEMGLPVNKLICASNENNVLTDFLNTGVYDIRKETRSFSLTNSPSMDILVSSNLERLLYLLNGRNGAEISKWMKQLETDGYYKVSDKVFKGMTEVSGFTPGYCDSDETISAIRELWENDGYLMDTHTAVAYKVYEEYVKKTGDKTPTLIASTASPFKFSEAVLKAVGKGENGAGIQAIDALSKETGLDIPAPLYGLDKREVRHPGVINIEEIEKVVLL